ncbi:hypothetical protein ABW19_dt0205223 [Dactylella cylindrospora]|nr:hypothetical protein ABW19_dt0205223 [Dactylella cylindrospora]
MYYIHSKDIIRRHRVRVRSNSENATSSETCFSGIDTVDEIQCSFSVQNETFPVEGIEKVESCCQNNFAGNFTYISSCGYHCSARSRDYLYLNRTQTVVPTILKNEWLKCLRQGVNRTLTASDDASCNVTHSQNQEVVDISGGSKVNIGVIVLASVAVVLIAVILLCWTYRSTSFMNKVFKKIKNTFLICSDFKKH